MFRVYKKLFQYVPEKRHLVYVSIVFSVISAILSVFSYQFLYQFLEQLIENNRIDKSITYAIFIFLFLLFDTLFYVVALWCSHVFAFRLETNLRKKGIEGLAQSSFTFYDQNPSGKIRKIIDDNAAQTHMIVAHLISDNTRALLMPILILCFGFYMDFTIGVTMLLLTLFSMLLLARMTGEKEFMKTYTQALERMNSETVEYVRGIQVIKIFRTKIEAFKTLYDAIMHYSQFALKYSMSCRRPYVLFQLIFFGAMAFILPIWMIIFATQDSREHMLVSLLFLACYTGLLFTSIMRVMYISMYVFMAESAVDKLEHLFFMMKKDNLEEGNLTQFENHSIEFQNVTFGYGEEPIFKNLSFRLEPNKTYALIGSSGGGKSTLAKLISGFYTIQGGTICIGDQDIRSYTKEALMKEISFVFQDAKLFKTSIYDNVKIGNEQATNDQVLHALHLACCDEILDKFPEREHTVVGSTGVHLSGGEKQRIAIARAILKDAPIVILDEASAATDPENEHELQKAFSNLMKGKTVIMIAHRLTSIKHVDEILVIDHGEIVERGTHEQLMKQKTRYQQFQHLYAMANEWRLYESKTN